MAPLTAQNPIIQNSHASPSIGANIARMAPIVGPMGAAPFALLRLAPMRDTLAMPMVLACPHTPLSTEPPSLAVAVAVPFSFHGQP